MLKHTAITLLLAGLAGWALSPDDAAAQDASPSSSRLSFAKAITFPTEVQQPISIAAGDLNGDGFPDVMVVSAANGGEYPYVSYALGKGNGKFGPWLYGPATTAPAFVLLADATGNGKLDALTTDAVGNDIDIAFGDDDGGFLSNQHFNVDAAYLAVADVSGEKIPDIVGSGGGPSSVFVMLGQGKRKFGQPTTFPSGGDNPVGVAVGDLRHNGIRDLVVVNHGNLYGQNANVAVLLGNGDGTFQNPVTYPAGTEPSVVVLGDFNGDGNLDIAVCNINNVVNVLPGRGDGTFSMAKAYPAGQGPNWIVAADFNGDGNLDLAVADDTYPGYVSVLLGNGDGTFQKPRRFPVGTNSWQLVVADFNHDGRPDLATVNNGDSTVSVLLNTTKFPVRTRRRH